MHYINSKIEIFRKFIKLLIFNDAINHYIDFSKLDKASFNHIVGFKMVELILFSKIF